MSRGASVPLRFQVCRVLRQPYRYSRELTDGVLDDILSASDLVVENADLIRRILVTANAVGCDLPDVFVALSGQRVGCEATVMSDLPSTRQVIFLASF